MSQGIQFCGWPEQTDAMLVEEASERLQLEWISAAEGLRFSGIMKEMEALRRTVSKEEIQETVEILKTRTPRRIRFGTERIEVKTIWELTFFKQSEQDSVSKIQEE